MEFLDLGYGDERFQESVNEDLHCPICTNVLKQPVHCGPSEHYFCKSCITRHLENNTKCPCCMKELSLEKLHPPSRFVTNRLSKLTISCDNFDRGCPELIELGNLGFHVKKCEFSLVVCSNDGCTSTMNRKDLAEHETDICPFRKRKCDECVEMKKELEEMKTSLKEVKAQLLAMENVKEVLCPMTIGLKDDMKNLQDTMKRLNKADVREDFIVMGGCEKPNLATNSVELFSWSTKSWKTLKPMNKCRAKSSTVVYKDQIIALGGITSPSTDPSRFPPMTDDIVVTPLNGVTKDSTTWANFPAALPRKRSAHKCVVYGDRVFVVGGCDQKKGKSSDSIDEVQLTAPYSSKPLVYHMPCRRSYHGAELINDKIVIAGGTCSGNMNECLDSVLEYDVNNKKLRALAPLPFAVTGFGTAVWGDKLVLIGGVDKNANRLDTVLMYDVKSGKSTKLPPMKHNREGCTAVVTGNVIVAMGGHNANEGTLKSVEYFSFERYSWNDLPPMNQPRSYASAVVKTT